MSNLVLVLFLFNLDSSLLLEIFDSLYFFFVNYWQIGLSYQSVSDIDGKTL